MDPNKFCFIICLNDPVMYQEALVYINHLTLPEQVRTECIGIRDSESITKAYNAAMRSSDAKYKVYLHQDVFIINKTFIFDVMELFTQHADIGMLGVAGASQVPPNGVWWESAYTYGKVYDSHSQGKIGLLSFRDVDDDYQKVQCIDGLLMVTQYDIPWREDLFTGWHFYDMSQSLEFIRAGYTVAVPRQIAPWCIHDCGITEVSSDYNEYRLTFLQEYAKDGHFKIGPSNI